MKIVKKIIEYLVIVTCLFFTILLYKYGYYIHACFEAAMGILFIIWVEYVGDTKNKKD